MTLPEILVMDRGFVLVGRCRLDPDDYLSLLVDDCCTVRRWGTTEGLGQLAREGPLPETVLDPEGDGVRVNRLYVYRCIPCSEKGWSQWTPSMPPISTARARR
jgi:hypothetical protein